MAADVHGLDQVRGQFHGDKVLSKIHIKASLIIEIGFGNIKMDVNQLMMEACEHKSGHIIHRNQTDLDFSKEN